MASIVQGFGYGLLVSVDIVSPIVFLGASKTVRKKLRNVVLLNGALIAIGTLEQLKLRIVLGNAVWVAWSGQPIPAGASTATADALILLAVVAPLFLASVLLSGIWSGQAVSRAWALQSLATANDSGSSSTTRAAPDPLTQVAEGIYRMLLFMVANIFTAALDAVPVIGHTTAVMLAAVLTSLIAFDSKWSQLTPFMSIKDRFTRVETCWAFFLGHGLLTSLLTFTPSPVWNAACYACLSALMSLQALRVRDADIPPSAGVRLRVLAPAQHLVNAVLRAAAAYAGGAAKRRGSAS